MFKFFICVVCALARKRFKIGTYTEEEKANMKSSLELLMKEEDVEEQIIEGLEDEDNPIIIQYTFN